MTKAIGAHHIVSSGPQLFNAHEDLELPFFSDIDEVVERV